VQKKVPHSREIGTQPRHNEPEEEDDDEEESDDEEPSIPRPVSRNPVSSTKPLKSILKRTTKEDASIPSNTTRSPSPLARVPRVVKDKLAQDDAEIAALEKKLGMKGKKRKSSGDDGLDDLFGDLDDGEDLAEEPALKRKRSGDDEWLASKRRKALGMAIEAEDMSESDSDLQDDSDLDEDDFSTEEELGEHDDDGTDDDPEDFDGFKSEESPAPVQPRVRENPYAAPVSSTSTPSAKYIPPSLRGPPSSDAEALSRLRRQIQGLLNRLSEANLITILKEVEKIYENNPRSYVSTTMIDLLLGLLSDETTLSDTFLILHAGFITAVYKVVGTDFGAQLVERIVSEFDSQYSRSQGTDAGGKQTTNLISLMAQLYNFHVIGSNLVFDYIRLLLDELSELNTELLLRVIKSSHLLLYIYHYTEANTYVVSGAQLRQDDPSALKDIVVLLQKSQAKVGESNLSVRTKFMVESIKNLKDNKVKTGVAASAIISEHTIRMKKTLGSLNTRTIKASEPLRIGLTDIRDTDKKGKWWLVGASWKYDYEKHDTQTPTTHESKDSTQIMSSEGDGTTNLLQLAREQRMNTDIRRAIFVTIMSATDFKDAHVRLLNLRLKRAQEPEIARVLIHCAGSEQSYNPYYTLIARKVCTDRSVKKSFQFALWDIFKSLGEKKEGEASSDQDEEESEGMTTRKIVNLGRMFGELIANGRVPITSLKASSSLKNSPTLES
jgi:nucleolar MIF4G domain-containing protein 1